MTRQKSVGSGEDSQLVWVCSTHSPCVFFPPACSVLGVAQLDSVIIASPPIEDGVNLSLEHLQPYWEELENLVQSKKIVAIGTSDLDKTQLEQLYQWAQVKGVHILTLATLERHPSSACSLWGWLLNVRAWRQALSKALGAWSFECNMSNWTEYSSHLK